MNTDDVRYTSINREGDTVVYSVPVLRYAWEKPRDIFQKVWDQIRHARSTAEVNAFLDKGLTFNKVPDSAVAKWKRAATRRIKELETTKPISEK